MLRTLKSRARCMRTARVLQAYLDGEVTAAVAEAVSEHLEECRRCGLEASAYRAIKASVAAIADGHPAEVDAAVIERLNGFAQGLSHSPPTAEDWKGSAPPED